MTIADARLVRPAKLDMRAWRGPTWASPLRGMTTKSARDGALGGRVIVVGAERFVVNDGVPVHWMTDETEIIKADTCQDSKLADSYFENKVVKGLLLSVKHSSSSKSLNGDDVMVELPEVGQLWHTVIVFFDEEAGLGGLLHHLRPRCHVKFLGWVGTVVAVANLRQLFQQFLPRVRVGLFDGANDEPPWIALRHCVRGCAGGWGGLQRFLVQNGRIAW